MTTFQGLPGEKSSSRVLRPPGGGDSNIFGSDDPPKHTHRKMAPQPPSNNIFGPTTLQNPPPRNKENTGDNIFGSVASDQKTTVMSTEQNHQNKEKDEENIQKAALNNIDEPSLAQSAKSYAKRMQEGSYNPITGEGGQDTAGAKSRVRQPPGGFSSKLW